MPETAIPQTPYVRARQEWDERFGDQIKSKNNWRLVAFIAMGTTFFCVAGMVAIGYSTSVEAQRADSDSSIEGSSNHEPESTGSVFPCWRSGGQRL